MMNKEIKKVWLEALRSGDYEQTTGHLKKRDGYCCLGVLCNLGPSKNWNIVSEYDEANNIHTFTGPDGDESKTMIPCDVRLRTGLSDDEAETLADMNDRGGTFNEIADYIEENL